jgi:hypothetical protein
MTTKITVDVPAGHGWKVHVKIEDQKYDHEKKAMSADWIVVEDGHVNPGEKRDFWLSSSRRATFDEIPTTGA